MELKLKGKTRINISNSLVWRTGVVKDSVLATADYLECADVMCLNTMCEDCLFNTTERLSIADVIVDPEEV